MTRNTAIIPASGNHGYGGGVYVRNGTFTKTGGGVIYGDNDTVDSDDSYGAHENTATDSANAGTNGHAVLYRVYNSGSYTYFYRNETLDTGDDISADGVTTGSLGAFEGYRQGA